MNCFILVHKAAKLARLTHIKSQPIAATCKQAIEKVKAAAKEGQ